MNILIIGGTVFLGRAIADAALARGHAVTLFNRGQSNSSLFPQAEHVRGDRTSDLGKLEGRRWDVVIDTCGYEPSVVRLSARALAGSVDRYIYISTASVYADLDAPGADEGRGLHAPEPGSDPATFTPATHYSLLKALCEAEVAEALPGRSFSVRPGLIVGPWDPTERYGFWVHRIARGGPVVAPGKPDASVQTIDARDLADWLILMAERGTTGVMNTVGPIGTLHDMFEGIRASLGSDATFEWVDPEFLAANLPQSTYLPLRAELTTPGVAGLFEIDGRLAVENGLRFRPPAETARDTANWLRTLPTDYVWRAGLSPAQEATLVESWREARSGVETTSNR